MNCIENKMIAMNMIAGNIDPTSFLLWAAWLLTALLIFMGFTFLKNLLSFMILKIYELFIGSKNHLAPY